MADLGQEAINKVAEIGIKSQLDEVENVEVNIETDPLKVLSGDVDSVSVKGEGMVMKQDLRIEEMHLNTGSVSINPLSVAFGKIELEQPTEAEAYVVLTEADINRAFHSDFIRDKMQNLEVHINGELATVNTDTIEFGLPGDGRIFLAAEVLLQNTQEKKRVAFTAIPTIQENGKKIVLDNVEYIEGQDLSSDLTNALLEETSELLDLRNFELKGMALRLKKLDVQHEKLILQSEAIVEQFPSS